MNISSENFLIKWKKCEFIWFIEEKVRNILNIS